MIRVLGISSGVLALALTFVSCQWIDTRESLAVSRSLVDATAKERDVYADAAASKDTLIEALNGALTDIRAHARQDSLRLVAERNWWARRAKQDGARLDSLAQSLATDNVECDDLLSFW